MAQVRDLLSKDPKIRLELKEDADRGVYVKDLTQHIVKSTADCEQVRPLSPRVTVEGGEV